MERGGDELLADAALPLDQHRHERRLEARELGEQQAHHARRADHAAVALLRVRHERVIERRHLCRLDVDHQGRRPDLEPRAERQHHARDPLAEVVRAVAAAEIADRHAVGPERQLDVLARHGPRSDHDAAALRRADHERRAPEAHARRPRFGVDHAH